MSMNGNNAFAWHHMHEQAVALQLERLNSKCAPFFMKQRLIFFNRKVYGIGEKSMK